MIIYGIVLVISTGYILYVTVRSLQTGESSLRFRKVRRDEHPFIYWYNIILPLIMLILVWVWIVVENVTRVVKK
ncbi:MAG TPA: hypothetical protein VKS81_02570 [Bacteroidota bacterium]|nr:hypothetical protein [Bacteroidota bacterium]